MTEVRVRHFGGMIVIDVPGTKAQRTVVQISDAAQLERIAERVRAEADIEILNNHNGR
jgi:hypothetical protein